MILLDMFLGFFLIVANIPEVVIPPEMLEASKKVCPFCADQISSSTPKLLPEIATEGRLRRGSAWLFPNAFPYARHNWVIVLCKDHFLYPGQFSAEMLQDGFLVAQEGIKRLGRTQPEFQYAYINWNHLPPSGAGIFHPHIQVVIEDVPTTSHKKVLEGLRCYQKDGKPSFWQDYLQEEIKRGERYIGHQGDVHFLTAFSPRGIFGEILILFSRRSTIDEVKTEDWAHFSQGMTNVFQYLNDHIVSFNLSLFSGRIPIYLPALSIPGLFSEFNRLKNPLQRTPVKNPPPHTIRTKRETNRNREGFDQ